MSDVKITVKEGILGPLELGDLKVLRAAINNAIEVSVSSSDVESLRQSLRFVTSVIEEHITPGR